MNNDTDYMQKALEQAQLAQSHDEVPIGAVLVKDNAIIAASCNQTRCLNDPTAHAEVLVLREGAKTLNNYRLLNTTLYVTLEPCAMCIGAMIQARVQRLVYGASDSKAGAVNSHFGLHDSPVLNHKITSQAGVLADASAELLATFFKNKRTRKHNHD